MNVTIPKCNNDHSNYPCWCPAVKTHPEDILKPEDEKRKIPVRPHIRCKCGYYCGIGNHHVHSDGRVTASFFHSKESDPIRGCDWHVFLILENYDGGEWKPGEDSKSEEGGKE